MMMMVKHYSAALMLLCSGAAALAEAPVQSPASPPAATAPADSGLIKNGDFEIGVDPAECRQLAAWDFESDEGPQSWEFHSSAGTAALIKGDAASAEKFLRIKAEKMAIIMQKIALKEPGTIQITAKARGNGQFSVYRMLYDKQTGKYQKTPQCGKAMTLNSPEWQDFSTTYEYDGKANEYLALFVMKSPKGIDIDRVTVKYLPETPAAAKQ